MARRQRLPRRSRPHPSSRTAAGFTAAASILLLAIALPAHAGTVYNTLELTSPYGYSHAEGSGMGPASDYGHGYHYYAVTPATGRMYLMTDIYAWSWGLGINIGRAEAEAILGEYDISCTRSDWFRLQIELTLNGMAGLYIPSAAGWLAYLRAQCRVELHFELVDQASPLIPLIQDLHYLVNVDDDYTAAADIWSWSHEPLSFTTSQVYLSPGKRYRASVRMKVFSRVQSEGTTGGGSSIAVFSPYSFNFGGQHYDMSGYARVDHIRVVNQNPDHTAPATVFVPSTGLNPANTCAGIIDGVLSSQDNAGGFGVDQVYWRHVGGAWVPYQGNEDFFTIHDDLRLEFYATDIAGNVEPVKSFVYDFIPEPPALISPSSGGGAVLEPVVLRWLERGGYSSETVQVAEDPQFDSVVFEQEDVNACAMPLGLDPGTTYYWRAQSLHDSCGVWSNWSEAREFEITDQQMNVIAFGDDGIGQLDIPYPNRGFFGVGAGTDHSLLIRDDGRVEALGRNYYGTCNVPEPNTGFVAVDGGMHQSLGLKEDGTLVAWGSMSSVPEPNGGFVGISCGLGHNLALRRDGSIEAWGSNAQGQCDVPGPNTGFVDIAGGYLHSLALRSNGTVVAFGSNADGQLDVPEPNADFVAVAAGQAHSMALKRDGSIIVWGESRFHQHDVPQPNTGFVAIATCTYTSVALRADGTLAVWGDDEFGQNMVPDPNSDFFIVACGHGHVLALRPWDGVTAVDDERPAELPKSLEITRVAPNPFNPRATISYGVAAAGPIRLEIFDLRGRYVCTLIDVPQDVGRYEAIWSGRDHQGALVTSGVYVARLQSTEEVVTTRLTLIR